MEPTTTPMKTTTRDITINILASYRLRMANGDRAILRAELEEARKDLADFLFNLDAAGVFSFSELTITKRAELEANRLAVIVADIALGRANA